MTVAKKAGVSASTVSYVLSGKRTISPKVCRKVRKIIDELGYRANPAARTLSSKKSMQIGIVTDEISNSISSCLVETLEEKFSRHGYKVLLGISKWDRPKAFQYIREFASGMTDGIINMVGGISIDEAIRESRGIPVITHMRPQKESPVYIDMLTGSMLVMEHLWSLGHRKIGFIRTPDDAPEVGMERREMGYRQFFARMAINPPENLIMEGKGLVENGYRCAEPLLKAGATAIFASNDMMAVGVLQWAYQKGIKVPEELSVAGFDDSPIALAVSPPLTTVQIPVTIIAEKTAQALIDRINGKEIVRQEVIVPTLIVRQSTGKPKRRAKR